MDDDSKLGPVARRLAATERVLCIEDEADIAAFLRAYFRAAGYDLIHIDPDDIDAALAAAAEHEPDIVLLDLRLRGFSGTEVYRRLRSDDRFTFTPVIMVSADNSPALRPSKGLDAFVAKPFNTNTLADIVRDRIAASHEMSDKGRHARLPHLTQHYLEARLSDEIAVTGRDERFAFALVRLLGLDDVVADVGDVGREHVVDKIVGQIRDQLPDDTVTGLSDADEAAIIFPARNRDDSEAVLAAVMEAVGGEFVFPGGATVHVKVAAGIAEFPANAASPDELFMAADAALAEAVDTDTLLAHAL